LAQNERPVKRTLILLSATLATLVGCGALPSPAGNAAPVPVSVAAAVPPEGRLTVEVAELI